MFLTSQLFSALYSMLPESKGYLTDDNWSDQTAGLIMMGCFIGGFIGIQVVSRVLHQFMPSHVVDCDHTHDDQAAEEAQSYRSVSHERQESRVSRSRRRFSRRRSSRPASLKHPQGLENGHTHANESTPLLDSELNGRSKPLVRVASERNAEMAECPGVPLAAPRARAATAGPDPANRRPSMFQVQKRVMSFVKDTKNNCDELGNCYGFTDPCGQECFKHLGSRPVTGTGTTRGPTMVRTTTGPFYPSSGSVFHGTQEQHRDEYAEPTSPLFRTSRAASREPIEPPLEEVPEDQSPTEEDHHPHHHHEHNHNHDHSHSHNHSHNHSHSHGPGNDDGDEDDEDLEAQHHHHVPTNAFLSIGLQTSIAIALHKFPEGFITYATNHANPQLGFNVFMALFVHNISEGFAMCLPLYMALGSRWRAMAWSAVLGGLSQPLGAAIAALWFHVAKRSHMTPSPVAYACLFAATSGIMVSVALQLFVESLSLNHNRNLSIFFGFLGMAILGLSNAFFSH